MTSDRSQAYGRVMHTLAELGPVKLQPGELERLRDAADTLLFCEDAGDPVAVQAIDDARSMLDHLVSSDRWTEERAAGLAEDLAACGPLAPVV